MDYNFYPVLGNNQCVQGFVKIESEDLTSGWEWDKLSLYRETREAATRFFINRVPAGKVTLTYVLRPTIPGKFRALPAQAQSMYAPEFGAHTGTELLTVDK